MELAASRINEATCLKNFPTLTMNKSLSSSLHGIVRAIQTIANISVPNTLALYLDNRAPYWQVRHAV
jgi:hypothetical protein